MKKSSKKQKVNISKKKQELTVDIIRYNRVIDDLKKNIIKSINLCNDISEKTFGSQRELIARKRMNERVLVSALKMIENNQLYLWMIDEVALNEKNE